ncbi:MAG: histidine--tRNA ligase [Candidatus Omnitrophica bacterium]|nr:histidine--tRNA ligase [Candidatus Omnitrophota bacterium]
MALQALRGTTDLLVDDVRRWLAVEHVARRLARLYGYQELRTPIIEDAALFLRSVGETTDIVQKEMFRVTDRGDHEIVLRPEGTAAVASAYRQFHQYGVEAIGSQSPVVDAEVITLCMQILRECGVTGATVWLSSMGCRADQATTANDLRKRLAPHRAELCKDCQARFEKNVFRVLDCKNPTCHGLAWDKSYTPEERSRPSWPFLLCDDCRRYDEEVQRLLTQSGVVFERGKTFTRGLDYYTRTIFEVRAQGLGAQDAVAAGGRYDHLVEELGGPAMGAVGFAAGIERLLMAIEAQRPQADSPTRRGLYLAVAQPALLAEGFRFVQQLRERGVVAIMDYDGKSLKSQLREADKAGCQLVAILGEMEMKQRAITVKDLEQSAQRTVAFEAFVDEVATFVARWQSD